MVGWSDPGSSRLWVRPLCLQKQHALVLKKTGFLVHQARILRSGLWISPARQCGILLKHCTSLWAWHHDAARAVPCVAGGRKGLGVFIGSAAPWSSSLTNCPPQSRYSCPDSVYFFITIIIICIICLIDMLSHAVIILHRAKGCDLFRQWIPSSLNWRGAKQVHEVNTGEHISQSQRKWEMRTQERRLHQNCATVLQLFLNLGLSKLVS